MPKYDICKHIWQHQRVHFLKYLYDVATQIEANKL